MKREFKNIILSAFVVLFLIGKAEPVSWTMSEAQQEAKQLAASIQNESKPESTLIRLTDYLSIAKANNQRLKAAYYQWAAVLENSKSSGSLPDPVFNYGYFGKNIETRVGPQIQRFSLRQTFPWFGTLGAKKGAFFEESNYLYQKYLAVEEELFFEVKNLYYDLWLQKKKLLKAQDSYILLSGWESVVRTKYTASEVPQSDLLTIQIELGKLENSILTIENEQQLIRDKLQDVLYLDSETSLDVEDSLSVNHRKLNSNEIIESALKQNPNLLAISHLIAKNKNLQKTAARESYPDFTFGLDYIETGEALNPALDESGKDAYMVSVGINIPLWFSKNSSKKKEAALKVKSTESQYHDSVNRLRTTVSQVLFDHDTALRDYNLYRYGLLPKTDQLLEVSFVSYKSGKISIIDLLSYQKDLLKFQFMADSAYVQIAKNQSKIELLTASQN